MSKQKYLLSIPLLMLCIACSKSQNYQSNNSAEKVDSSTVDESTISNEKEKMKGEVETEETSTDYAASETKVNESLLNELTEVNWTPQKISQLEEYMISFGKSMGQYYTSYRLKSRELLYYDKDKGINWSLPSEVFSGNPKAGVKLNGNSISAAWYTVDASKLTADFVIYALISDHGQINISSNHTYVFGIYHNKPTVALIDKETSHEHMLMLHTTKNENLLNTFDSICKGTEYELEEDNMILDSNRLTESEALKIGESYHPKDTGIYLVYFPNIKEDEYGRFVQLRLIIKEWRDAGGSGTAGFMRIYENGMVLDGQLPVNS